jgi:hypothetical protein
LRCGAIPALVSPHVRGLEGGPGLPTTLKRGGKGIILIDASERNGPVAGIELVLVTDRGQTIRAGCPVNDPSPIAFHA